MAKSKIDEFKNINENLKNILNSEDNINDKKRATLLLEQESLNRQKLILELSKQKLDKEDDNYKLLKNTTEEEDKYQKSLNKSNKLKEIRNGLEQEFLSQLKKGWTYLQDSDKIIRSTTLYLGMSGVKAELLRNSFNDTAKFSARLGGTLADISTIFQGYADETGRAQAMTSQMTKDILLIGKGTGLGVEQATKLVGQFDYMGISSENTVKNVQGIVDTSERMGINTTKVLTNLNNNFKKLNTFTFVKGSKAMGEMAMSAEKTRVSMETTLNFADAHRSLESIIDLGANLQIMGGEFAKMDPFQWLYKVRNEPEKLIDDISEMTRGLFTLKKNSKGTFESFISPADADRLRFVGKQLGKTNEEMFQIGQRRMFLDKLGGTLNALGFTKEQKEMVAGLAKLDDKTGKFIVPLSDGFVNLENLTKEQAQAFISERSSLDERARNAMTFNETFKSTIEILKASLLPLLKVVNEMLKGVKWVVDGFMRIGGGFGGAVAAASILLTAGLLWKGVGMLFNKSSIGLSKMSGGFLSKAKGGGSGFGSDLFTKKGAPELLSEQGDLAKAQGLKNLGTGAGVGVAALGIGGGLAIAACGISKLADSMQKLDATQVAALPYVILSLGGAFLLFTPAITAAAAASTEGSVGLLALGATALGIGAGIGIAALGIGEMAKGLGDLVNKSKGAGNDFLKVALGIAGIGASLMIFSTPLALAGLFGFSLAMLDIAAVAPSMKIVGDAFEKIGNGVVNLKGSASDFIAIKNAVESISKANTSGGGMLAELSNLLKSPLKVEFANNSVMLRNDITLEIDGTKLMNKTYDVNVAIQNYARAHGGLESNTQNSNATMPKSH